MTDASPCPTFLPDMPCLEAALASGRPVTLALSRARYVPCSGVAAAGRVRAPDDVRAAARVAARLAHGVAASGTPRNTSSGSWWSSDPAGTTYGTRSSVDARDSSPSAQRPPACPRPPSEGGRTRRAPARVGRNSRAAHAARGPAGGRVTFGERRRVSSRERRRLTLAPTPGSPPGGHGLREVSPVIRDHRTGQRNRRLPGRSPTRGRPAGNRATDTNYTINKYI